jgi:hypothetical protein
MKFFKTNCIDNELLNIEISIGILHLIETTTANPNSSFESAEICAASLQNEQFSDLAECR